MTSYYVAQAFVEGPREEIAGMLNTILRNVGVDSLLSDMDDVASANLKIKNPKTGLSLGLRRSDFFDEELVLEAGLQQKRDSFLAENAEYITADEYVNLVEVTEKDGNWVVKFTEGEDECDTNIDWPDWEAKRNGGHVFIPEDITDECPAFLRPADIESIEVHPDNPSFSSEGNCLLSKDRTEVILGCRNSVIPDSVRHVCQGAFRNIPGGREIEEKYSCDDDSFLPF